MPPDFATYPATRKGAESIVQALLSNLVRLWKMERRVHSSDDLVAIINTEQRKIVLEPRSAVITYLKKEKPQSDLLNYVVNSAPSKPGLVSVWAIIGFTSGEACIIPIVLARS